MIHYHGTPMSGTRVDVVRFFAGRHALVPFSRRDDLGAVAEVCQSWVADNGAFSVWKRGLKLDVPGYLAWLHDWCKHPGFDWALIPDVIQGSSEENDALVEAWPNDIRGVPVYHMHEPLDRAVRLAHTWPTVALGSSGEWSTPGTQGWWIRMAAIMEAVCDSDGRPPCRFHGLRMLNPKVFTKLPLSSADSCNATRNCNAAWAPGGYSLPNAAQRAEVIASRVEAHNSASASDRMGWALS